MAYAKRLADFGYFPEKTQKKATKLTLNSIKGYKIIGLEHHARPGPAHIYSGISVIVPVYIGFYHISQTANRLHYSGIILRSLKIYARCVKS